MVLVFPAVCPTCLWKLRLELCHEVQDVLAVEVDVAPVLVVEEEADVVAFDGRRIRAGHQGLVVDVPAEGHLDTVDDGYASEVYVVAFFAGLVFPDDVNHWFDSFVRSSERRCSEGGRCEISVLFVHVQFLVRLEACT